LNVLGTTCEATSLSVEEREQVMEAAAASLPRERLMVGTGAASVTDATRLTRTAARLGFAGALVLPPFYYKGVPAEGLLAYLASLIDATADSRLPIYLYHYPALSGIPWTVEVISAALARFPGRIAGLKDSSGDLPYSRQVAALSPDLAVYPSNEATLLEARSGPFAGCISASVNVNADLCQLAFRNGDSTALANAVAIRGLFQGMNLVAGVKGLLASIHGDMGLARTRPPLPALTAAESAALGARAAEIRKVAA
jgi:4-hydroxy-tetrahydrodipicolinate synthase